MIKQHAHWVTLGSLDDDGIERAPADRIDTLVRVAVVGRKMEAAGFIVNHPASHRDGVPQDFVGQPELSKSVNAAGGKGEVDRPSADGISGAGIGAAFVEFDLVTALPEEGAE
jgi:hypothetical protein